jgi:hypothetical protein
MPRITPVHWTVLEKVFLAAGFWFARQEGSHRSYIKPGISSYDSDRLQKSQIFLQKDKNQSLCSIPASVLVVEAKTICQPIPAQ